MCVRTASAYLFAGGGTPFAGPPPPKDNHPPQPAGRPCDSLSGSNCQLPVALRGDNFTHQPVMPGVHTAPVPAPGCNSPLTRQWSNPHLVSRPRRSCHDLPPNVQECHPVVPRPQPGPARPQVRSPHLADEYRQHPVICKHRLPHPARQSNRRRALPPGQVCDGTSLSSRPSHGYVPKGAAVFSHYQ